MNHFSLVKYHSCVQLAHLYEHLFVNTVTEYLYHHSQYKLLDYALNGETHTSGVLLIQGECYNTKVSTLLENIATMPADLNGGNPGNLPVAKAMSQLLAESANDLYIGDPDEIISELALLNSMPWKPLDTIDLLPKPAATVNNSTDLIYETNQSTKKAPNIELSLSITEQPIELRMLWREFAKYLSLSIGQAICQRFGAYFLQESAKNTLNATVATSIFLTSSYLQPKIKLEDIVTTVKHTFTTITQPEVLHRFSQYLSSLSYANNPHAAPDSSRIAQEFGIIVGARGWRRLATLENLSQILKATRITVAHEDTTITIT